MRGVATEHTATNEQRSTTGWTKVSAATMALMDEPGAPGQQIISMTSAENTAAFIDKVVAYDLSSVEGLVEVEVYNGGPDNTTGKFGRLTMYLSADAGYTNYIGWGTYNLFPGWNAVPFIRGVRPGNDIPGGANTGTGSGRVNAIRMRMRTEAMTAVALQTGLKSIKWGQKARPLVCIRCDDWVDNAYDNFHAAMVEHKLPYTMFGITGALGEPGYWTADEADDAVASGYCRIGNHTVDHAFNVMPTATEDECLQQIIPATEFIAGRWAIPGDISPWLFANPYGETGTNYNKALRMSGIKQAFSTVGEALSWNFTLNPLYANTMIFDSFSTTGLIGGATGSFQAGAMTAFCARMDYALASGGIVIPGFHQTVEGTPAASTQMSLDQLNEFLAWCEKRRAIADFAFLSDAVQYSMKRVGRA